MSIQQKDREKLFNLISLYKNKELFFDEVIKSKEIWKIIGKLLVIIFGLTFLYGFIMGSYHSLLQAIVAGFKVPILFIGAIIICFPSFFIIQIILGSKLTLGQMLEIILLGFLLMTIIMVSFSSIVIFFQITGGNYHFLQLLHVAIFTFSGIFGMWLILNALKYSCEKKEIYPKTGVIVFRIWIVILAFVAIQLAWNLRPFLANKSEPFAFFRKYEGNFYTAIIYSLNHLSDKKEDDIFKKRNNIQDPLSSFLIKTNQY